MLLSAILSFLGGSAFRMIWGELSAAWTKRQEQSHEIERMRVQAELEAAQHQRNMEALRVQAELGVKTIQVQGEADVARIEAEAFSRSQADAAKPSGIYIVDLWNGMVRPAAATLALWLWLRALWAQQWAMQGRDWDLVCAILGWFFADRTLGKRGK